MLGGNIFGRINNLYNNFVKLANTFAHMTDQELRLELLKIAKTPNPLEMSASPLENAELYYHWVKDNLTYEEALEDWMEKAKEQGFIIEEENITPPVQVERVKDLTERLSKAQHIYSGEGIVGESTYTPEYDRQESIRKWKKLAEEIGIIYDTSIKQQVQSIVKTAQSEIQEQKLYYTKDLYSFEETICSATRQIEIYKNAFNKLLEL